jgi:hypothetical protein
VIIYRGRLSKKKNIKDTFIEILKDEYNSLLMALFSFGVNNNLYNLIIYRIALL